MKKISLLKVFWQYLLLTVGVFFYAFAWNAFMIPQGLSGGGLTGITTIIQYATNGAIPMSVSYLLINAVLIVIGAIVLGPVFGFKTLYCIAVSTFFLWLLPRLGWVATLSDIKDNLLNALIGGAVAAFGIFLVFRNGGSTGGTDILALVLSKFHDTSPGKVFMYSDFVIVGSIFFLPGHGLSDVVYGYIFTVAFSYMLDVFLTGSTNSVQIMIFTRKYKEVADALIAQDRGVTALSSTGWYTKSDGKVLVVVSRKSHMNEITKTVKDIDDKAFVSVGAVLGVYGERFEEIKSRPKKERSSKKGFLGLAVKNNKEK